jgi:hypothetical protein
MPDSETITLRKTLIGGQTYADDFTAIWCESSHRPDHAGGRRSKPACAKWIRIFLTP